jgi:hypothetical protein
MGFAAAIPRLFMLPKEEEAPSPSLQFLTNRIMFQILIWLTIGVRIIAECGDHSPAELAA